MENYKMFDIVYVDLSDSKGSEQSGIRPCIIVQNNTGNKYSPTVLVMCLTSVIKKENLPTHCVIHGSLQNGLKYDSMVMAETTCQISKERILYKAGHIDNDYDKNNIINAYLANITGQKCYTGVLSQVVCAICRFVIKIGKEEEHKRWSIG